MFKALLNVMVLFLLLLCNMALLTWCLNQLDLGKSAIEKTLISNVLAEATPTAHTAVSIIHEQITLPKSTPNQSAPRHPKQALTDNSSQSQQIILRFRSVEVNLDTSERQRLETRLAQLNISPAHSVQVLVGPAPSENHTQSPQNAKLRAQNVARVIYPYTQDVKMIYRPSLELGMVSVEFSQRPLKKG